jgi:hypothetical protein
MADYATLLRDHVTLTCALDNGFASCDDPAALQRICDRLGSGAVKSFFWRWVRRLPSPFTTAEELAARAGNTSNPPGPSGHPCSQRLGQASLILHWPIPRQAPRSQASRP